MLCSFRYFYFQCIVLFLVCFFSVNGLAVVPFKAAEGYISIFLYSFCPAETKPAGRDDSEPEGDRECNYCLEKSIGNSDMVLHLQLKIDPSLGPQIEKYLDRENILCVLKPSERGLLYQERKKQKIALSQLLCPECWWKYNSDNPKQSKSLVDELIITLPYEFKKLQSVLKESNQTLEAQTPASAQAQAPTNTSKSLFKRMLTNVLNKTFKRVSEDTSAELQRQDPNSIVDIFTDYRELELQNQLKEFTCYKELSNKFFEGKNILDTGLLGYPDESGWLKITYVDFPKDANGYFIFNSEIHPCLYKVIIDESGEKSVFKIADENNRKRSWASFLSESKKRLQDNEKLKPQTEKEQWFELSILLAALDVENE